MTTIQLTQGQVAIIDDVDADLASLRWHAHKDPKSRTYYAGHNVRRPDGGWRWEKIHQVIARRMGIVGIADHSDRDGLNNRRTNLRPANGSQNQGNVGRRSDNTSGFKGVGRDKRSGKWCARLRVNGKRRYLGAFSDPVDAALAYDRAALEAFGEFAVLNFPVEERKAA